MQIGKLEHVNIRTTQLEKMVAWYVEVLGMENGARPNFGFPGAWLYSGADAAVHLSTVDDDGVGSEVDLKLEHFAFSAKGSAAFEAKLKERGEAYRCGQIEDIRVVQFNVWDPDGNHIHIDFSMDE